MSRTRRGQAGYTMIEVAFVSALVLSGLAIIASLVGGTQELTTDTRAHSRAEAEHRKNLRALSNLLRNVDIATLAGFDQNGVATKPTFQRVAGVELDDRQYLGAERLEWVPTPGSVWGIPQPGLVRLVGPAGARPIALNVPAGGFLLRQEGNTLAIRLTTYYSLGDRRTAQVTSETAVSLRN